MRPVLVILFALSLLWCCTPGEKYDVDEFYGPTEQDSVLAGIIAHIFTPPPYTANKDRFLPKHKNYYSMLVPRFRFTKCYIADDKTNYYLVLRPGPTVDQMRAVGGHFKIGAHFELTEFREVFVTPLLSEKDLKERSEFLFDEMVKGTLDPYLKMKMYVQWPNEISYYDTIDYEWKMKPDAVK
jgi:hypothetical protein